MEDVEALKAEIARLKKERHAFSKALASSNKAFMQKVKEFSIVKRISDTIRWNLDHQDLCVSLIDIIVEETNAENCSLWLVNEAQGTIELTVARGQDDERACYFPNSGKLPKSMPLGTGIAGRAAAERRSILVGDVRQSQDFYKDYETVKKITSLLCVPLILENKVLGVLNLSHPRIGAFSRENELVIDLITRQASFAFSNLHLFQTIQGLNLELEKKVEERAQHLKESQKRYKLAVNAGRVAIWEWYPQRERLFVSENFARLLGYDPGEFGYSLDAYRQVCHPEDFPNLQARIQGYLAHPVEPAFFQEIRLLAKDGSEMWFLVRGALSLGERSRERRMIGSITDISQLKRAEHALKEAQKVALENAHVAGKAEVANGVLHNIGNVLSSVNISCSEMKKVVRDTKIKKLLMAHDLIKEHETNLGDFFANHPQGKLLPPYLLKVGQVLSKEYGLLTSVAQELESQVELMRDIILTQQSYAKAGVEAQWHPPGQLLEESLKIQADSLLRRNVKVEKNYCPGLRIWVPKSKLCHVLINLLKNAIEAMEHLPENERILYLATELNESGSVMIHIRDRGIGICPATMKQLFSHGFTTKATGHGFGLHYCKQTVIELGGHIEVHSLGANLGTTFTLNFKKPVEEVCP